LQTACHIVFICSRLDTPGGIERAVISLANLLNEKGHTITLFVAEEGGATFYPLAKSIAVVQKPLTFGIEAGKSSLYNKIKYLKDIFTLRKLLLKLSPDAVISTEYHYAAASVITGLGKKMNLLSWEHHHYHGLPKSRFWQAVVKRTYPRLAHVVCLNTDETALFTKAGCKAVTIPHFLKLPAANNLTARKKEILTIGWLSHAKGTDILMPILKKVLSKYPDWVWRFIGKGDMLEQLQSFANENNLVNQLLITAPHENDLTAYYQSASLLVHASRKEAFGLTIAEAMSHRVPAIAFNCPTGPRHIIKNEEDGVLVSNGNSGELFIAICTLMEDEEQRKKMGEKAFENIQRFSLKKNYPLWEKLLNA
jgi:glycosyltransferase involved in cell wall biosynthesis